MGTTRMRKWQLGDDRIPNNVPNSFACRFSRACLLVAPMINFWRETSQGMAEREAPSTCIREERWSG